MEEIHPAKFEKPLVLVVEDDADLLQVIAGELTHCYQVVEALDGKQGLEFALKMMPDVVVSDILMPVMDGAEFCRRLKGNPVTSHIPFVMLTSKSTVENQVEGFRCGADHYLTKPFHTELLEACIDSLLESREHVRERLRREVSLEGLVVSEREADKEFVEKALTAVRKHMSDPEFRSVELAKALGVGLRTLQRKLKAVSDCSPARFISEVRMRHAAELVAKTSLSITEIGFEVGSEHSSNFAQVFKQHYGKSPSEFRAERRLN